ncbi:MAG: beta-lactamase family protein [Candidatus Eremiobacteraeota bacterium]|nr:beta-lactamase family protein [Candidatus Eremiobacteraeota bacterium]
MRSSSRRGCRTFAEAALLAAAFFCASLAPAAAATLGVVREARIDRIVAYVMHDRSIPGLALGIAREGRPLYMRGYGVMRPGGRARVRSTTIFSIGSLTKSFTSAATLLAIRSGALAFSTPLLGDPAANVRDALAMAAGIADYANLPGFSSERREPIAPLALYDAALRAPRAFSAGARGGYSNSDYLALALTLQNVEHRPYERILQRTLLALLHLRATAVAWPAFAPPATYARGNVPAGSPTLGFGVADLASNVPDLLRWYAAFFGGKILSRDWLAATLPPVALPGGGESAYGDGLVAARFFGRSVWLVRGYVAGYSSIAVHLRRDRLDLVILTNADRVDLTPLARSIVARALDIRDPLR